MAEGLNQVTLIGNLGQDPEVKQVGQGSVMKLRLATTERYKTRDGEWKERTDWHSVDMWGARAEALGRMLHKGSRVCVTGRIEYRSYEDRNGNKRHATSINARNLLMLDSKADGQRSGGGYGGGRPQRDEPVDDFGDDEMPF